jgi:hypothetical protein
LDFPAQNAAKAEPSALPRAIADVPKEIADAGSSAFEGVKNLSPFGRGQEGSIERLMKTGRGILAVPELIMAPVTGAARSLIGHPVAAAETAIGSYFNPKVAKEREESGAAYNDAKTSVDTAMSAMAAKRGAPTAITVPKPATIGDFDVPLTQGEAVSDLNKIALERRALRGGEGEGAQKVAEDFMARRDEALKNARGEVAREMDPAGQRVVDTPQEAAALAGEGIQSSAQGLKDIAKARYDEMASLPGEFKPDAFSGIANHIKNHLSAGANPVIIDTTTPIAARALADIDQNISRLSIPNAAAPLGAPDPIDIVGINLKGVDQQRKRLVQFYKDAKGWPPTPDQRATQAVLKAFDDQVEFAITQGLFSGDHRALQALKEARGAHSTYKRLFSSQGSGDDVGRAMEHILGKSYREPATPTEIANYLYGASNVGAKGLSFRLAQRLKTVLGEQSPEWAGVKQGLWSKLTETPAGATDWGPEKVSNQIAKFLNGDGKALADRMFTQPQRELMERYSDLLKKTVSPPGAVNYSNNVPMLKKLGDAAVKYLGALVGLHLGGPIGGAAGLAAGMGLKGVMEAGQARKISKMMPSITESIERWQRAQAKAMSGTPASEKALAFATTNLLSQLRQVGFDGMSALRQQGATAGG